MTGPIQFVRVPRRSPGFRDPTLALTAISHPEQLVTTSVVRTQVPEAVPHRVATLSAQSAVENERGSASLNMMIKLATTRGFVIPAEITITGRSILRKLTLLGT